MGTRIGSLIFLLATASTAVSQSVKDSAKALEAALKTKPHVLRGFSMDRDVVWRWDGAKLVEEPSLGHMLAVIEVKSVKLRGDRLDIEGARRELLRTSDTALELGKDAEPMAVHVEFHGGDPAKVVASVEDAVFYTDDQSAIADLPREYRGALPQDATPDCCKARPNRTRMSSCPVDAATGEKVRMTQPRVLHAADPEFSEEARRRKISGNVMGGLRVDENGQPGDLWVIRPVGLGLDEKAIEAVSRYQFRPASCGDTPAATSLYVEVNFQIF